MNLDWNKQVTLKEDYDKKIMKKILNLKAKLNQKIRDKAIGRAKTRIVLAGKTPEDFNEEQLEVIVKEEEDQIIGSAKEKGLLVLASLLGLSLWS